MQEAFFEYLSNVGLEYEDADDLKAALHLMSRSKLEQLIDELEMYIQEPTVRASSPFDFLANSTYSGAPTPCGDFTCRSERLRDLAYFTTLYANKVMFSSPFRMLEDIEDDDSLRKELAFFIYSLQQLRPLFDADLLELTPHSSTMFCSSCYAKMINETASSFQKSLRILTKELDRRYLEEVEYYAGFHGGMLAIFPRGELVDEHFYARTFYDPPPQLSKIARKAQSPVRISKTQAKKLKLPNMVYGDALEDILHQNYYSTRYGTSYLTQRSLDLELIQALSPKPMRDTNALLAESFSHELPVIGNIKLKDLIRVRKDEGDSFQVYRDSLNKAIQEVKNDSPQKMKQAFGDVVLPEINRINAALSKAKKTLLRKVVVDTAVTTGVVSVGLFSGILPPNIGQIFAALGGFHYLQNTASKLSELTLEPTTLKDNNFYFLWKVMQQGKK